jgi:hypothetical protein
MDFLEKANSAYHALDQNNPKQAALLVGELEADFLTLSDPKLQLQTYSDIGGVMIDVGTSLRDEGMVARGTEHTEYALSKAQHPVARVHLLYNAANGHSALWNIRRQSRFISGTIDASHIRSKDLYREAIRLLDNDPGLVPPELKRELLVNFANMLDGIMRSVEAIAFYDLALGIDPSMGMALGNKGITLNALSRLAHGHTHQFVLTARELLLKAIQCPLVEPAISDFKATLAGIDDLIARHGEFRPEPQEEKTSHGPFHQFLREFCARHSLYLTPSTVLGRPEWSVYGDPLYITGMHTALDDDTKFDRCITFLNQIKQDYVLARYFLVQSQYKSDVVETIDRDVALYYPLDYSMHSAYIQLLKMSFRLAIDVLDKIALFVRDYFGVGSISEERVNFRTFWAETPTSTTLRPELASKQNWFLLALFDLALDFRKGGAYEWMYQKRNILTHRFLALHDVVQPTGKDGDIPRAQINDFVLDCLTAMQVARAAAMYLILAVEVEEGKIPQSGQFTMVSGTLVDDTFRWRPSSGSWQYPQHG